MKNMYPSIALGIWASLFVTLVIASSAGAGPVTGAGGPQPLVHLAPISVVKNVTVGVRPTGVVYDPANQEVYVSNTGANTVSVLNGSTNKVVATVKVGTHPDALLYDPTNREMYVLNSGSNSISVLSTSNKVLATASIRGTIFELPIYDPANGDVYVLSSAYVPPLTFDYNLSKIDHHTNNVTLIKVGAGPNYAIYDNATTEVVVSNGGASSVSFVNSSTNAVTTVKLTTGTIPLWMVYDARNQEVYALDEGSFTKATPGYVSVFSTSHTVVASVKVADRPVTATVDPVNGEVVVVNTGVPNSTTGAYPATTLNVISSLNKLTATVKVGHEGFYAIWSPSTQDFYIPCEQSNATYVLNGTTNLLLSKPLATGQYPVAAFYDPGRGEMLVVGNSNTTGTPTKTVVTLLTSANKVAGTLLLGKGPTGGGAYDPKNSDVYASDEGANELSILH